MVERVKSPRRGGIYNLASPGPVRSFIPSGSTRLDLVLGGGWAEGRIANVIGDSATGKTLLMIEASRNFADKYPKGIIRYRETESAFDLDYAKAIGMPVKRVDFGDHPLVTVEDLFNDLSQGIAQAVKSKQPELYIVDSLDALSDTAELEEGFGKSSYGASKAKDMSKLFRKLPLAQMEESKVTLIIVSQVRDRIGVKFGRKWTRSGGRALTFYCSQIVVLGSLGAEHKTLNNVKYTVGLNVRVHCEKNKVGTSQRDCDFPILFGYGIDDIESCLSYLDTHNHLKPLLNGGRESVFAAMLRDKTGDWKKHYARMTQAVQECWQATEAKLVPRRAKYD